MKKNALAILIVFFFIGIPVCWASDNTENQNSGLLRTLHANHSLLSEYQEEYARLKNETSLHPSEALGKKMKDVEDKIKALQDDSEELQSFLPINSQAREFVMDLMAKKVSAEKLKEFEAAEDLLKEASLKHAMPLSAPNKESAYQMHERALQYVTQKKYNEAVKIYEEIVLRNPEDDEAYLIMGHTYLLMGQYQKAESAFHNAVHIDPENIHEIMPFYENTVLQNPSDDGAFANLGYAYLIVGDVLRSRDAFRESLRINAENQAAQNGLAYLERLAKNH